jgi:hypothetical protein
MSLWAKKFEYKMYGPEEYDLYTATFYERITGNEWLVETDWPHHSGESKFKDKQKALTFFESFLLDSLGHEKEGDIP